MLKNILFFTFLLFFPLFVLGDAKTLSPYSAQHLSLDKKEEIKTSSNEESNQEKENVPADSPSLEDKSNQMYALNKNLDEAINKGYSNFKQFFLYNQDQHPLSQDYTKSTIMGFIILVLTALCWRAQNIISKKIESKFAIHISERFKSKLHQLIISLGILISGYLIARFLLVTHKNNLILVNGLFSILIFTTFYKFFDTKSVSALSFLHDKKIKRFFSILLKYFSFWFIAIVCLFNELIHIKPTASVHFKALNDNLDTFVYSVVYLFITSYLLIALYSLDFIETSHKFRRFYNKKYCRILKSVAAIFLISSFFLYVFKELLLIDQQAWQFTLTVFILSAFMLWSFKTLRLCHMFMHLIGQKTLSMKLFNIFGLKNIVDHGSKGLYILYPFITLSYLMFIWNISEYFSALDKLFELVIRKSLVIFFILYITQKIYTLLDFVIYSLINKRQSRPGSLQDNGRFFTLLAIFSHVTPIVWIPAFVLILLQFGVDGTLLFASISIFTVAIGFGAKNLIEDVIRGILLVIDNTLNIGDMVNINNEKIGFIEKLSLQNLSWRSYDGVLHTINYGRINIVDNHVANFAFAVLDVSVAYKEDLKNVMQIMREVASDMRTQEDFKDLILEDIQISGVDQFNNSAVDIKARIKTLPPHQFTVRRFFNLLLKERFDKEGIEIPFPQQDIHFRSPLVIIKEKTPAS